MWFIFFNLRLDGSDPEANLLDLFSRRLCNGNMIFEDFELVRSNCCENFMGVDEFNRRVFNDSNNLTYVNDRNSVCTTKTYR